MSIDMAIPAIPRRPGRMCTIEQEIGYSNAYATTNPPPQDYDENCDEYCDCDDCIASRRGSDSAGIVLSHLNNNGLCDQDRVYGYGDGGYHNFGTRHIRVERDSSCGGEVIHAFMDLSDRSVADIFARQLQTVQDAGATCDESCGAHVHIDISRATIPTCISLYHVWNYLEDTIFRIAAHSTTHRESITGSGYSPPTRKMDPSNGTVAIAYMLQSNRSALNMSNYMYSITNGCSCGAVSFGLPGECVCTGGKRTVEFRVWDGTTDMRRIRMYLALSHAMVGHVWEREVNPARLPVFSYQGARPSGTDWQRKTQTRLAFILERLPLTDRERCDIGYCVNTYATDLLPAMRAVAKDYLPGGHVYETEVELQSQPTPMVDTAGDMFAVTNNDRGPF